MNTLKKGTSKLITQINKLEKLIDSKAPFDITVIKYFVFAGVATVVDLSILFILTEFFSVYYILSAGIAYSAGMLTNFTLNKFLTFENNDTQYAKQFSKFFIIALIGLGLNQLIIYLLVENFEIWYMFARVISLFIVFSWSYLGNKHFTFRD
jgi:putative flippase GtrA